MNRNVQVAWAKKPFGCDANVVAMFEHQTVLELIETAIRFHGLPARFLRFGYVRINDIEVPKKFWHLVRPRIGAGIDVIVTFHLPLHDGGGNGNKNPLATIALIAVLIAATLVSGGVLGPASWGVAGSLGIGTLTISGAVSTGILLGGSLLIAALTPPPRLAAPEPTTAFQDNEGKAASLTGNVLAPGSSIPRVIGTRRVFPPFACEPLSELIGDIEYVEAVMVLAGPHALSALRVGGAAADDESALTYEMHDGLPGSLHQTIVQRQGKTVLPNTELSRHIVDKTTQYNLINQSTPLTSVPQWHNVISRVGPDEIWIRLVWVEGLFDDTAPTTAINQPIRIRFRKHGDSTWINCPEIHFSANKPGPFQKDIRFKWGTIPASPNLPQLNQAPIYAYKSVPAQTADPVGSIFNADSYFSNGAGNDLLSQSTIATSNVKNTELFIDKVVFWMSAATYSQDVKYEIQVKCGEAYNPSAITFNPATYTGTAPHEDGGSDIHDFFFYYISATTGLARVVTDQSTIHSRIVLKSIASVWNEDPITTDDFAQIGVKVKGRSLDQFSVLASGYVADLTGGNWSNVITTSNPAPHYRDVLVGTLNSKPMPVDLVDDTDLTAWRQACIDNSYTADMVVDGRAGFDVLTAIAAAGYARPRQSEKWGVLIDEDKSAQSPVQIFSPRNLNGLRFERPFSIRPTGFRVRFDDSTNDYIQDEIIVLDPLDSTADESRLEDIRYDAIVDETKAIARAEFDLKQADLRFSFYHASVSAEALVCRRGDLVGIQHDAIYNYAGFSRVLTVLTSGPNVIGLVLDGSIPIITEDAWSGTAAAWSSYSSAWSVPRTGIAIRLRDGTLITKEIVTTNSPDVVETDDISFVTPFTIPGGGILAEDCLVTSGPLTQEYSRMLVFEITPSQDFTANITFVPEAPELWN